jgi:hypothetical protein
MITVTFSDQELAALAGLIDQGIRALGLACVKDASAILVKLEAAKLAQQAQTDAPA